MTDLTCPRRDACASAPLYAPAWPVRAASVAVAAELARATDPAWPERSASVSRICSVACSAQSRRASTRHPGQGRGGSRPARSIVALRLDPFSAAHPGRRSPTVDSASREASERAAVQRRCRICTTRTRLKFRRGWRGRPPTVAATTTWRQWSEVTREFGHPRTSEGRSMDIYWRRTSENILG